MFEQKETAPGMGIGSGLKALEQGGSTAILPDPLAAAHELITAGIPVFTCKPALDDRGEWDAHGGTGGTGYWIPPGWQHTRPDPSTLDGYQPGYALAAVMGHGLDVLDVDPRHDGNTSLAALDGAGMIPDVYARATTPSGGEHLLIASTGIASRDDVEPGLDVKAGHDGQGHGFVFIAPTVRASKTTGELTPYTWTDAPDAGHIATEAPHDDTGQALAAHVTAKRAATVPTTTEGDLPPGPWDDVPAALAQGRHSGVLRLAAALRGRGGWREGDAHSYMKATVWPLIDQSAGGHPFTLDEFTSTIRDAFNRYPDGPTLDPTPEATTLHDDGADFAIHVTREAYQIKVRQAAREAVAAEQAATLTLPPSHDLATFLAEPDEPTAYRVNELLPTGGRAVLAAQHKAGKTTLMANLIRSLVDGDMFLGTYPVKTARRVVLLDNELDPRMLRRWLRDQNIVNTTAVTVIPLRGHLSTFNLLDEHTRTKWAEHIGQADLVIFDCLRPALDALGLDENRDAGRFLEAFDELTTHAGISEAVIVHHMGHGGERSRGDSRILDWPDAVWKLLRDGEDDDLAAADRYFTAYGRDVDVKESRVAYDHSTRSLTIAGGSRQDHRAGKALTADRALIVNLLDGHPKGMSGNELATAAARKDKAFTTARDSLVSSGEVLAERRPGRGGGVNYVLNTPNLPNIPKHPEPVSTEPTEPPYIEGGSVQGSSLQNLPSIKPPCTRCGDPLDHPAIMTACEQNHRVLKDGGLNPQWEAAG